MVSDERRVNGNEEEQPEYRRAFTAEITFAGLGVLLLEGSERGDQGSRGPREVDKLKLLFVRTGEVDHGHGHEHADHGDVDHRHYPRLTYYADDHLGLMPRSETWPHDYVYTPSPEGRETVSVDLTDKRVEVIAPNKYERTISTLNWLQPSPNGADLPDFPRTEEEDRCLDWVLRSDQIYLGETDARRAVTTIEVPHGTWMTRGVYRNREVLTLDHVRWRVGERVQAMGRDLVLVLEGLRYGLTVRISNFDCDDPDPHDIVLTPGSDDRLRLALTNLPGSYSPPDISHVTMYGHLAAGDPPRLSAPVQSDDVVCALASCDHIISTGKWGKW